MKSNEVRLLTNARGSAFRCNLTLLLYTTGNRGQILYVVFSFNKWEFEYSGITKANSQNDA